MEEETRGIGEDMLPLTQSTRLFTIMTILVVAAIGLIAIVLYQRDQHRAILNQEEILDSLSILLGEQVGQSSVHQKAMTQFVNDSEEFYDEVREFMNQTK